MSEKKVTKGKPVFLAVGDNSWGKASTAKAAERIARKNHGSSEPFKLISLFEGEAGVRFEVNSYDGSVSWSGGSAKKLTIETK